MIGVVSFPGSNGDRDALFALEHDVGVPARLIDYRERELRGVDGIVLPGGFSYLDALQCGAKARFAPVMGPLREFADAGGPVLGICNGFQLLTEAHLLPGALRRNRTRRFHSHWTPIRIEGTTGELARLEAEGQVVARYCDAKDNIPQKNNWNGSSNSIAGVSNRRGNLVGLMPHPERVCDPLLGGSDGLLLLRRALAVLAMAA